MTPSGGRHSNRLSLQDRGLRDAALSSLMLAALFATIIGVGDLRAFLAHSPNITLEKPGISIMDGIPSPGLYLTFTLRNSGDADGYAHVGLFVNESLCWSRTYLVKLGTSMLAEELVGFECRPPHPDIDWWNGSAVKLLSASRALFFINPGII